MSQEINDDEIVGTILSRREALTAAAKAGFGLIFAGVASTGTAQTSPKIHLVASPQLEEGPFFVEEKLNRSNLLIGTTRASVVQGVPLSLTIAVHSLQSGVLSPLKGAQVDIWHTDALGVYSDISAPMNNENTAHQSWLRGYQVTDGHGNVHFDTIFPGWYPSRTTHIHLKIRNYSPTNNVTAEFTTQLFFDDKFADAIFASAPYANRGQREMYNSNDGVYGVRQVDGTAAGEHLTVELQQHGKGFATRFAVALTTDNFNMRGGGRRRGPDFGP